MDNGFGKGLARRAKVALNQWKYAMRFCKIYGLYDASGNIRYIGQTWQSLEKRKQWFFRGIAIKKTKGGRLSKVEKWIDTGVDFEIKLIDAESTWNVSEIIYIDRFRQRGADLLNVSPGGNYFHISIRWMERTCVDLRKLLAHRMSDPSIEKYLHNPKLLGKENPSSIGMAIGLTFQERIKLGITAIRPSDISWRECRKIYKKERNDRKRINAEQRRRSEGIRPISESLMRIRPWEKEGISRSTWYKRKQSNRENSP